MTAAITTTHQPQPLALVRADAPLLFSDDQREMIRNSYARGSTESEFEVLMAVASARRLNPLLKQIFFVKHESRKHNTVTWTPMVSIDGMRAIAQRTGVYDGQDEPVFEYAEGIVKCTVRVYRKDWGRPSVGVAFFDEYAQRWPSGDLKDFWARMPHVMISKCAEAIALRKAFPEDTSGLYVPEEMGDAPEVIDVQPERAKQAPQAATSHDAETGEVHERSDQELQIVADFKHAISTIETKEDEQKIITDVLRNPFSDESRAELKKAIEAQRRKRAAAERRAAKETTPANDATPDGAKGGK